MLVSGLVFNLSPGLAGDAAFDLLQRHPALTLGPRVGNLLSAALTTSDVAQSRDFHDQMQATRGVEYVDVVYVGFEEDPGSAPAPGAANRALAVHTDAQFSTTISESPDATLFDARARRTAAEAAALPN